MSSLNLPIHPTLCHPLTGEPLRAVYVDKHGRPRFPIMGGAPDDPPADPPKTDPPADPPKTDPPADPPKTDPPADLGFPKDTPVAEMKPAEQTAYWQHQARKHEDRNKEWQKTHGGKTAAEVQAELTQLRNATMSESEKALETAKTEGRREASLAVAPQMFDVALKHVAEDRRKVLIDSLDLAKVIKEDGTVDTDKVTAIAATLAPPATGTGTPDYGQGPRGTRTSSGVGAGRDAYAAETGKK